MAKRTPDSEISELKRQLDKIESKLKDLTIKVASATDKSNIFWNSIQRDANKYYEEARNIFAIWSKENLPYFFNENIREQIKRMKTMSFGFKIPDYRKYINKDLNKQTISSILKDTVGVYRSAVDQGQKQYTQLIRQTQQLLLTEYQLNNQLSEGFEEKRSVYGSRKKLQQELLKKNLDGKTIVIIDKNGKPTTWDLKAYSEMVAKTKIIQSETDGTVNLATSIGADLVQVSSHNTNTPFDAQFEGKIFSLSGKDPDFPPAEVLPPFHPNCKHTITVVIKEGLEVNGTLQKYIDYSNNITDVHPTRKSHIPVSERFKEEKK